MGNEPGRNEQYVSRETQGRLDMLEGLVKKWNPTINLVSKDSINNLRHRHIDDSLQIFDLADHESGLWCDLGSGGGFPGLVVAILAADSSRAIRLELVESDGRKCAFLREAIRQLEVDASVVHSRIEDLPKRSAAVLSARALAPLSKLCEFAHQHLSPEGIALFPKGSSHQDEIAAARKIWSFDLQLHPSKTDERAAILALRNINRA